LVDVEFPGRFSAKPYTTLAVAIDRILFHSCRTEPFLLAIALGRYHLASVKHTTLMVSREVIVFV
jgi:hypothetical protein